MSSTGVTYARGRVGRVAQANAAKAKRNKLLIAGGGVLLLVVLAIQVPRTLRMLSPAEATVAPAEAVVVPSVPVPAAPPTTVSPSDTARLKAIELKYTAKDPFAGRVAGGSAGTVRVRPAPAGERDPFGTTAGGFAQPVPAAATLAGVRDPFTPRTVNVSDAAPPATPPPAPLPARPRGYTIILVSIPVAGGRASAVQASAAARARGVRRVGVLRSSDFPTLRPGYFAVYSRLFETRAEAQRAVGQARALGYPRAYVRPLGR